MKALPMLRHVFRVAFPTLFPVAALLLSAAARAEVAPAAHATSAENATEVKVERVRPKREKHLTLRFLKENRDFIRSRYDLLRVRPEAQRGAADQIDPRFLAYRRMLSEIQSARDSVAALEEARRRRELFASITELGRLEAQLDLMERLLAEQRGRLGVLQEDFTGLQRTTLAIVVSGYPHDATVSSVSIKLDDGALLSIPLSPDQRESLQRGGVLQIFNGLVEPREQVVEVAIAGDRWPAANSGFVTLEPSRDRLTFLKLDLTPVEPTQGASSILASTWLQDTRLHTSGGPESVP